MCVLWWSFEPMISTKCLQNFSRINSILLDRYTYVYLHYLLYNRYIVSVPCLTVKCPHVTLVMFWRLHRDSIPSKMSKINLNAQCCNRETLNKASRYTQCDKETLDKVSSHSSKLINFCEKKKILKILLSVFKRYCVADRQICKIVKFKLELRLVNN